MPVSFARAQQAHDIGFFIHTARAGCNRKNRAAGLVIGGLDIPTYTETATLTVGMIKEYGVSEKKPKKDPANKPAPNEGGTGICLPGPSRSEPSSILANRASGEASLMVQSRVRYSHSTSAYSIN